MFPYFHHIPAAGLIVEVDGLSQKYKDAEIKFNGCVVDSAKTNMDTVHKVNEKPTNSCTLAATLATFRQIDVFEGRLYHGERIVLIEDWSALYNRYSTELSCPTKFHLSKVDKFIEKISLNARGLQKDVEKCQALLSSVRDMLKFICFPTPNNDHVTTTAIGIITGLEYFHSNQFTKGIVLRYTIMLGYIHSKISGGTTEVWSNYKLEKFFESVDDKDRESLIQICTKLNPNFKFVTKHKNSQQPSFRQRAVPQINLLGGWTTTNLMAILHFIFTCTNNESDFSCIFCNAQFNKKKLCYNHFKFAHGIKFPEFREKQPSQFVS